MTRLQDITTEIIPEIKQERGLHRRLAAKNLGYATLQAAAFACIITHEYVPVVLAAEVVAFAPRAQAAISQSRAARKATRDIIKIEELQENLGNGFQSNVKVVDQQLPELPPSLSSPATAE